MCPSIRHDDFKSAIAISQDPGRGGKSALPGQPGTVSVGLEMRSEEGSNVTRVHRLRIISVLQW